MSALRLYIRDSALKRGYSRDEIGHAVDMALVAEFELDPDNDPPKLLYIGPDYAGNFLEVIGGFLQDGRLMIWHAMACRASYLGLLPPGGEP